MLGRANCARRGVVCQPGESRPERQAGFSRAHGGSRIRRFRPNGSRNLEQGRMSRYGPPGGAAADVFSMARPAHEDGEREPTRCGALVGHYPENLLRRSIPVRYRKYRGPARHGPSGAHSNMLLKKGKLSVVSSTPCARAGRVPSMRLTIVTCAISHANAFYPIDRSNC
jgi:hypothetical protein